VGHQIDNCPYRFNSVFLAHTRLTNHELCLVSLPIQSRVLNIQNPVYPLALPNVACRKPVVPPISVPFTKNVIEQNLVGFPNSMYPHVGPYTPYFGSGYGGVGDVPKCGLLCLIL
jgi:hypothetical protein